MEMTVKNQGIAVHAMDVTDVSRSSIVLIGDADAIVLSSIFDTPIDSLIREKGGQERPGKATNSCVQWGADFFKEAGESE